MASQPRYQQVAEDLRSKIRSGSYAVGALLPTETDLCEAYNVSRYTVREALRALLNDGLISRRQGSGTVVQQANPPRRFEQSIRSVGDLLQYATDSSFRFTVDGDVTADSSLAALLNCTVGAHWLMLHGVRSMPGMTRPVCLTEVYVAPQFADATRRLEQGHGPLFLQLEQVYGVHVERITQTFQAVALSAGQARRLGADAGAPALRIVRTYFDSNGSPIEISVSHHAGDLFTYSMQLETPEA
jgi:GntR family transcriptional regulator